ncbi:hypothetical protein LOCC1_G003702 [Lachnellula occidentalis]|uniref:Phytanoyl-CoA hydroxylase n=1 Tax=Lachnellula occidentalis TaxID=215460 RepID=A0A8H8UJR7_9HELO|nr:hypothetical protein LOCC1_G003702 [Lachnellula occidentalis]
MPYLESQVPLFVNDGQLKPQNVDYLKPTTLDTPVEEIRRRYKEDGYVYMKGVLPREDILKVREEYFKLLSPSGVLKPGTAPVDGIFNPAGDKHDYPAFGAGHYAGPNPGPGEERSARYLELGLRAHSEPWFKEMLVHHPALLGFAERLTGWGEDTVVLQRALLRTNTPGNEAIGIHYDQIFLRHGEDSVLTAWVPIGDIKANGGGLIYLEKSYSLGTEMEKEFTDKAKASGMTEKETENAFNQNMMAGGMLSQGPIEFGEHYKRKWLVADYEAGDAVFHNAYFIHASTRNHDPEGRIRLGTDIRFANSKRPWDTRWTKDFEFGDGL